MIFLAFNVLQSGVQLSMVCAVIGLVFAFVLIAVVKRAPAGNERMRQISGAVQEGAKAYLNRQVITISSIAAIIFILLFIFKDRPTAIGFVIGAFCSLSAGYIGMRIAVIANVRTTQAATSSIMKALRMAFNGGAVTGLLVVGLALLAAFTPQRLTSARTWWARLRRDSKKMIRAIPLRLQTTLGTTSAIVPVWLPTCSRRMR